MYTGRDTIIGEIEDDLMKYMPSRKYVVGWKIIDKEGRLLAEYVVERYEG